MLTDLVEGTGALLYDVRGDGATVTDALAISGTCPSQGLRPQQTPPDALVLAAPSPHATCGGGLAIKLSEGVDGSGGGADPDVSGAGEVVL